MTNKPKAILMRLSCFNPYQSLSKFIYRPIPPVASNRVVQVFIQITPCTLASMLQKTFMRPGLGGQEDFIAALFGCTADNFRMLFLLVIDQLIKTIPVIISHGNNRIANKYPAPFN